MLAFVTLVPVLSRTFTSFPCVVLEFLLIVLVIILTSGGKMLHGTPNWGRFFMVFSFFHFLILISLHQTVYLLVWCSFISYFWWWLFSLSLEWDCLTLCTGVFYPDNEFKQVPLMWRVNEVANKNNSGKWKAITSERIKNTYFKVFYSCCYGY